MRKPILAIALIFGFATTLLVGTPARALNCDFPGPIVGTGVREQRFLQFDLYIPTHETMCANSVGTIAFVEKAESDAILDLQNRNANFIALNAPMNPIDYFYATTSRSGQTSGIVYHLPMMMQGFAVTTNIGSCATPAAGLRLTPLTLSLIYTGVITTWGDPLIANDQVDPDAIEGCGEQIAIAIREGDGWSNVVLKDYMSKQNPAFASLKQRETASLWPATVDIDCKGKSDNGMISCGAMSGAISYMPYKTAMISGLDIAAIENGAGKFVKPATNSAHTYASGCTSAVPPFLATTAGGAKVVDPNVFAARQEFLPPLQADWSQVSLTHGKKGYGLCSFHYILALQGSPGGMTQAQAKNNEDHLSIMASPTMQQRLTAYGYTPLPTFLRDAITTQINGIAN